MQYKDFFLLESWKNYVVSTNPEVMLYDFYVLSYLTTLPLNPSQKGFSGTLIGRDPDEIKLDIDEAERKLLPVLRDKLSEALFIAICAEIIHVLDIRQNYDKYKNSSVLKNYFRNYNNYGTNLPDEFKPTRNVDTPQQTPMSVDYLRSFKAATKAINDTGSSREQFARLCADMFRNLKWASAYGGPKWAEIADAYVLLNKTPQTNAQLQVAIDHAYDLQHNTGTVLNKVKTYYINNDISWLKKALDYKANLKSVYDSLTKCSSDMRKLALEAFKTAGIKKNTLQTTTPSGESVADKTDVSSSASDNTDFKVGDTVHYLFGTGHNTIDIYGTITAVDGNDNLDSIIQITKIVNLPLYLKNDWKVGFNVSAYKKYMYMTKITGGSSDKGKQFGVGDFIRYKVGTGDNVTDIYGTITAVNAMDEKSSIIKISKINSLPQSPSVVASRWIIGQQVSVYKAYMTKMGEKTTFKDDKVLKIGDVGTLDINGNVYEVKILNRISEYSTNVLVLKPIDIKYKNDNVVVGNKLVVGTTYLKNAFKSYNDTSVGAATKTGGDVNDETLIEELKKLPEQIENWLVSVPEYQRLITKLFGKSSKLKSEFTVTFADILTKNIVFKLKDDITDFGSNSGIIEKLKNSIYSIKIPFGLISKISSMLRTETGVDIKKIMTLSLLNSIIKSVYAKFDDKYNTMLSNLFSGVIKYVSVSKENTRSGFAEDLYNDILN